MAGDRTAKKVYQKLRYGTTIELGRVERLVLAATPNTSVGNNFLPAAHIAEKAGLTLNQTCGALRRLLKKGYVDCLRPFEDRLVTWTSWPFFEKCPEIARELF